MSNDDAADRTLDHQRLLKRAERERVARKEAERLLEEQSRALFEANRRLEQSYAELKLQSERTRTFLEHMPIAVIITDDDGIVESVNHLGKIKFGMAGDLVKEKPLQQFLPSIAETESLHLKSDFDSPQPFETVGSAADGRRFPCEVVAARIGSGGDARVVWMVRDISQRVEAERRRLQLEADLRQANRLESLGTMAGGIAHELNTPIQFVSDNMNFLGTSFADVLAGIESLKSKLAPETAKVVESAHDLTYLAEEIPLAIAQSREGLARVAEIILAIKRFSHPASAIKEPNDINQIIQTAATVSKNKWKYIAELEMDLTPDLPHVWSNAGELSQVFLNLIVNAAHAIEDNASGPKPGKIEIKTRAIDKAVECRITDNGIGIQPENLERIFDLFFTTKAPGRGTGQGLAVVHTIVTQSHTGRIEVESTPNEGTAFIITLPTARVSLPAQEESSGRT